jgi:hypothetical protein
MRKELSLGKTKQYYRNFHFCGVASSTILPAINSVKIISVGTDESTALSWSAVWNARANRTMRWEHGYGMWFLPGTDISVNQELRECASKYVWLLIMCSHNESCIFEAAAILWRGNVRVSSVELQCERTFSEDVKSNPTHFATRWWWKRMWKVTLWRCYLKVESCTHGVSRCGNLAYLSICDAKAD